MANAAPKEIDCQNGSWYWICGQEKLYAKKNANHLNLTGKKSCIICELNVLCKGIVEAQTHVTISAHALTIEAQETVPYAANHHSS